MSISYKLYNTASEHARINEWEKDESLPIASAKEVQERIMRLYPRIKSWERYEDTNTSPLWDYPVTYSALADDNCSLINRTYAVR